jgi:hypothetical protein
MDFISRAHLVIVIDLLERSWQTPDCKIELLQGMRYSIFQIVQRDFYLLSLPSVQVEAILIDFCVEMGWSSHSRDVGLTIPSTKTPSRCVRALEWKPNLGPSLLRIEGARKAMIDSKHMVE